MYPPEKLYSEIGRFVVEFEGLLQTTRDTISKYFRNHGDRTPAKMFMYDSHSSNLAKYFLTITLYFFKFNKGEIDDIKFNEVKKRIKKVHDHILKAGELRNDIVHGTWEISAAYTVEINLSNYRPKATSDGMIMSELILSPELLNPSIEMMQNLGYEIQLLGNVAETKNNSFAYDELFRKERLEAIDSIDFEAEKKKIFIIYTEFYDLELAENKYWEEQFNKPL